MRSGTGLPEMAFLRNAGAGLKPNVIYILADDLGYGDLSCYGRKTFSDAEYRCLGGEGDEIYPTLLGQHTYALSRCTLMTGQHTGHAPIRGNGKVEPEGHPSHMPTWQHREEYMQKYRGNFLPESSTTCPPMQRKPTTWLRDIRSGCRIWMPCLMKPELYRPNRNSIFPRDAITLGS